MSFCFSAKHFQLLKLKKSLFIAWASFRNDMLHYNQIIKVWGVNVVRVTYGENVVNEKSKKKKKIKKNIIKTLKT